MCAQLSEYSDVTQRHRRAWRSPLARITARPSFSLFIMHSACDAARARTHPSRSSNLPRGRNTGSALHVGSRGGARGRGCACGCALSIMNAMPRWFPGVLTCDMVTVHSLFCVWAVVVCGYRRLNAIDDHQLAAAQLAAEEHHVAPAHMFHVAQIITRGARKDAGRHARRSDGAACRRRSYAPRACRRAWRPLRRIQWRTMRQSSTSNSDNRRPSPRAAFCRRPSRRGRTP